MPPDQPVFDHDNPEWTDDDFARARLPTEMPDTLLAAFPQTRARVGRPPWSNKTSISLRVDSAVVERFKAGGPGWQTRMNQALRQAVGL